MNSRVIAARAVAAVMKGRSLDDALPDKADAFTRALTYGVLREHALLGQLVRQMLSQSTHEVVAALLCCGLYQLRSMDVAAHAAVNETVNACTDLGQPKLRGLVNAVLRRYQREGAQLDAALPDNAALRSSHPAWLVQRLQADWPQNWSEILQTNNHQAPMVLRVNRRRLSRDDYLQKLAVAGIAAQTLAECADAVVLAVPRAVQELPGFGEGEVSVQDAAAQLAADLLDLQPGQRLLDACAAPGGKTAHALERADVQVVALDSDAQRLQRVRENLQRLQLQAQVIAGDARRPSLWHPGAAYDRILLDAPCSGTGVIRRHPDIKWLRRDSDIAQMARTQSELLRALWPLLLPGGLLLYATCSTLSAEGEAVMATSLSQLAGAEIQPIQLPWGEALCNGWRIPPGGPHDGFYYAKIQRTK